MSIKIYHGYKLNISQEELMPFLIEYQNSIQEEIDIQIADLSQIVFAYKRIIDLFGIDRKVYTKLKKEIEQLYEKIKWSIAIIPKQNYFLAILYIPNSNWIKKFKQLDNVEYYGYWDNTDPPENISDKKWEEREKDWECLSYFTPVCKESLIYDPFTDWEFPNFFQMFELGQYTPEQLRDIIAQDLNRRFNINISFYKFKWKIPLITKELLLDTKLHINTKVRWQK